MSSFAGARSVDERRRRRLATSADECSAGGKAGRLPAGKPERGECRERTIRHFPLRKLISSKAWKLWGLGILGLMAAAGLVVAGWGAEARAEQLGPGFIRLFNLAEGRLLRGWTTLCLLLSAELTLLIWWCRSRSSGDFSGHYRIWWSAAAGLFLFSLLVATDGHMAAAETVEWLWGTRTVHQNVLVWFVPAAVVAAVLLRALQSDMRDCRLSRALVWAAGLSWLIAGLEQFQFELPVAVPHRKLAGVGFQLFGHWSLLMGLVLHARFVIHESAEPPAAREPRCRLRLRIPFPRIRLPRLRWRRQPKVMEASTTSTKAASRKRETEAVAKKAKPEKTTPEKTASRKPVRSVEPPAGEESETVDESVTEPTPAPKLVARSQPAAVVKSPIVESEPESHIAETSASDDDEAGWQEELVEDDAGRKWRADAAHTSDELPGLSKKQRKRLQKQQRQEQRQARSR